MIYLLYKYGIISAPLIHKAYIICKADIIPTGISPVTLGTDIVEKSKPNGAESR